MEVGKKYKLSYEILNHTSGALRAPRFGVNDHNGIDLPVNLGINTVTGSAFNSELAIKRHGDPTTLSLTNVSVTYFDEYVTGSYSGSSTSGGGNWYTGSSDPYNTNIYVTQSFDINTTKDLNAPVTDIVKVWYSSSKAIGGYTNIENNGFMVKWEDAIEFSSAEAIQPIMQFYSVDTNTIYPPVLEMKWDDQSFETGSLSEIDSTDVFVALDSNPGVFYRDSVNRFRLNVREEFPTRTFQTSSVYTDNKFLNSGSLYAIQDLDTNEFVIDFDPFSTKISCDARGNYFDVYMNGLEPERYYKILIKTEISGSTIVKDDRYYFKVING